jgi:hypothetical protein
MHHQIDDIIFTTEETPPLEDRATRFIDVHIYDQPAEENEPPIVESEEEPAPSPRRHIPLFMILSGVLGVVLIKSGRSI